MKILVLGAGRMGYGAAFDLAHNSPDVADVTVADSDLAKAEDVAAKVGSERVTVAQIDASDQAAVVELMRGHDAAISCVNYWYNESLSRAAIETGTNFCDLGGNNYVVDAQLDLGVLHDAEILRCEEPRGDCGDERLDLCHDDALDCRVDAHGARCDTGAEADH